MHFMSEMYAKMSASRIRFRTQRQRRRQSKKETCAEEKKSVQLAPSTSAAEKDWLAPLRDDIQFAPATYTYFALTNFVPLTVIAMVYFIFLLPALGFVDAAPTPWSNACGAFVLTDEQILYETLHGAERNRVSGFK